jgi:two-component system phosphate regulon sensor histidine kinase PhoR
VFDSFRRPVPDSFLPPAPASAPSDFLISLVDSLSDGVLAVTPDRRILLANPAMTPLLNRSPADALGKPLWEVLRHRELGELLDRTINTPGPENKEMVLGSNPERLFEVRSSPLMAEKGPNGAVLTFHDITPLRHLENIRKEFVANVSHELKTPLTALRAALDTLLEGAWKDPQHAQDFLQTAQDQTARLQRLIEDLLNLSRLERPSSSSARSLCTLQDVATRVSKAMEPLAQKNNISLHLQLPETPLFLPLDADELTQILFNLLDNALKFNRLNGNIVLRAREEGQQGILEVEDTGVGISMEDQTRIFERFFRADKARTTDQGGTGLGLAIVKHLVENRGGTITVSSPTGQGSTFTVRFPLGSPTHPNT